MQRQIMTNENTNTTTNTKTNGNTNTTTNTKTNENTNTKTNTETNGRSNPIQTLAVLLCLPPSLCLPPVPPSLFPFLLSGVNSCLLHVAASSSSKTKPNTNTNTHNYKHKQNTNTNMIISCFLSNRYQENWEESTIE